VSSVPRAAAGHRAGARTDRQPPGLAVPPVRDAVLLINPRSGNGKAERAGLVRECQARNIEPVVLGPGQDVVALAEAAIAGGAQLIGIAGGDGSLALVAGVAARHRVPMVVVPAGTRNHLAMDLGLDRGDVVGALDAYGAAMERTIDLGDVNGQPFINNVSLGLYAEIIRSPAYRDAKIDTTLSALPGLLGPNSRPFDLRFTDPAGERHTGAHVVQISNNPYGRTIGSLTSRPRLDSGRLGLITLQLPEGRPDPAFLAAIAAGRADRVPGFAAWEAPTFEVGSGDLVDAGMDGEALRLPPPLLFTIRPGALRIRVPRHASGLSPAARKQRAPARLRGLSRPGRAGVPRTP
jgi:diacylglycerol kinase family enzyme